MLIFTSLTHAVHLPSLVVRSPGLPAGGVLMMSFRGFRSDLKDEIKAGEARREKRMDELKEANRSLGEKFDRLVEVLLASGTRPFSRPATTVR